MRKVFLFLAALFTATVFNLQAGPVKQMSVDISSASLATKASPNWKNSMCYLNFKLDNNISVRVDTVYDAKGGVSVNQSGAYYKASGTSPADWRVYQTRVDSFFLEAANGALIDSVQLTYSINKDGTLSTKRGSSLGAEFCIASGTKIYVGGKSKVCLYVGNTSNRTDGQVCISNFRVVYTHYEVKDSVLNKTICHGESLMWRGNDCYESKAYHDTLRYDGTECDSVRFTLNLKVTAEVIENIENRTIRQGESFMWRGNTCNEAKAYHDTLRYDGTQCDSIHFTMNVQFEPAPQQILPKGIVANITGNRWSVKEKNMVVAGSPTKGYEAYFAATDTAAADVEQLWKTNGAESAVKVSSFSSEPNIKWLARFNEKVVFQAEGKLYISDGAAVTEIKVGGASLNNPMGFTQINENKFIFTATVGEKNHLFISDGTTAESLYADDAAGFSCVFPGEFHSDDMNAPWCRVGRRVYFKATTTAAGEELWITDGTAAGTRMVKDIHAGENGSNLTKMVNVNNQYLVFKAFNDSTRKNFLWYSDGTKAGTKYFDAPSLVQSDNTPRNVAVMKGKVYTGMKDTAAGLELFVFDPAAGTGALVKDFNAGKGDSWPDVLGEYQGQLMTVANVSGCNLFAVTEAGVATKAGWNIAFPDNGYAQVNGSFITYGLYTAVGGDWGLYRIDSVGGMATAKSIYKGVASGTSSDKIPCGYTMRSASNKLFFAVTSGDWAHKGDNRGVFCYQYCKEGGVAENLEIDFGPALITATFDMQGHGEQVEPQTIASGSKFEKPDDPQAEGCAFGGWFQEATCDNAFDFDKAVTASKDTTITIYAKWTELKSVKKDQFATGDEDGFAMNEDIETTITPAGTISDGQLNFSGTLVIKGNGSRILGIKVVYEGGYMQCEGKDVPNDGSMFTLANPALSCTLNLPDETPKRKISQEKALVTISSLEVIYEELPSIEGIELVAVNTIYDGKDHNIQVNGIIEGDVVTYSTDSATWKQDTIKLKNVSETNVFVRVQRTDYKDWGGKTTVTITPDTLTVLGTTVTDKVYDGTTTASVDAAGTLQGVIGTDDVSIDAAIGTFADKNVGDDKDVTVSFTLKGADANNYEVLEGESTASILKRDLTLQSADLEKKYDGRALTAYSLEGGTTITDLTAGQTNKGYVAGECFNYSSFIGSQLGVGNIENSFNVGESETALANNYNVTKQFGKLTVTTTDVLLTITAESGSRIYDGKPLSNNGYIVGGTLGAGDNVTDVVVSGTISTVGSIANKVTGYKIMHSGSQDVTDYYTNVQLIDGTLTIINPIQPQIVGMYNQWNIVLNVNQLTDTLENYIDGVILSPENVTWYVVKGDADVVDPTTGAVVDDELAAPATGFYHTEGKAMNDAYYCVVKVPETETILGITYFQSNVVFVKNEAPTAPIRKAIKDGQLVIIRDGATYNALGGKL